jgi:hypothetical protein
MDGKEWKFGKQVSISGTRPAIWCQRHCFRGQRGTEFLEDTTTRLTNALIFCSLGMMGKRDGKGSFKRIGRKLHFSLASNSG